MARTTAHARARNTRTAITISASPSAPSTYGAEAIGPRIVTMSSVCAPVRPTTAPASAAVPPAMRASSGGTAAAMSSSVAVAVGFVPGAA